MNFHRQCCKKRKKEKEKKKKRKNKNKKHKEKQRKAEKSKENKRKNKKEKERKRKKGTLNPEVIGCNTLVTLLVRGFGVLLLLAPTGVGVGACSLRGDAVSIAVPCALDFRV